MEKFVSGVLKNGAAKEFVRSRRIPVRFSSWPNSNTEQSFTLQQISRYLGSMAKMSTYFLSISRKHMTRSL